MDDSKIVAIFFLILGLFGAYLHWEGKLLPVLETVTGPDLEEQTISLSEFGIAFIVFLFILSFLQEKQAVWLTVIIVLGALQVNNARRGNNDLISTLLGGR